RKSELLGLEFEHINFGQTSVFYPVNSRVVEVRANHLLVVESKNSKPRSIPMNQAVRKTLCEIARDGSERSEGFSYSRNGVSDMTIREGVAKACYAGKIPYGQTKPGGIVWHDLRHTFATRLRELGVPAWEIMVLLGHSSVSMTASYAHSMPTVLQAAVERLTEGPGNVIPLRKAG